MKSIDVILTKKKEFHEKSTCILCNNPKQDNSFLCQQHKDEHIPWELDISQQTMRNFINKKLNDNNDKYKKKWKWIKDVPFGTRDLAIGQIIKDYFTNIKQYKKGIIKKFKMHFINKQKKPTLSFSIDSNSVSIKESQINNIKKRHIHLFPTLWKNETTKKSHSKLRINKQETKKLPNQIDTDVTILFDRGAYYIIIPMNIPLTNNQKKWKNISLDPGVRCIITGYSDQGIALKFGLKTHNEKIDKLISKIDKFRSLRDKTTSRRTKIHIKKRLKKLERKLRNITRNLHCEIGVTLARNFDTIFLPEFGTSKMLSLDNLQSITKRKMQIFSHYTLKQRLIHFCNKYGSKLYIVNEAFTTQTCGNCGKIPINKIISEKTYHCTCGYKCDRDHHGSRNIYIRTLTLFGKK